MNDERRARAVGAMADAGIDALILGREANARYVSGARRLWLANARAFAPGCVLLASGDVHILNASDDGIPADIPFEHIYPLRWNPANLWAQLSAIPQLAAARTIGVDALTPLMESLLTATFPRAELRDGQAVLFAARRQKGPSEIELMRRATRIATDALDDVILAAVPGARERDLRARFTARMCELGTTTPAFEGVFGGVFPSDRALESGERILFDVGVLVDGYEGGLARTIVCASDTTGPNPATDLFAAVAGAVRPGACGRDLRAVYEAAGVAPPAAPIANGVGIGVEPPFIGEDDDAFVEGMVLSLRAEIDGWVHRDAVVVTRDGSVLLEAER